MPATFADSIRLYIVAATTVPRADLDPKWFRRPRTGPRSPPLRRVVVQPHQRIADEDRQALPVPQRVPDRRAQAGRCEHALLIHPGLHLLDHGARLSSPQMPALFDGGRPPVDSV